MVRAELILKFSFVASHSLADYEKEHSHLWKMRFAVTGQPLTAKGMIIDMMVLRAEVQKLIDPLQGSFLNHHSAVNDEVRQFPTCETLGSFFLFRLNSLIQDQFVSVNPTVHVAWVEFGICDLDGVETGAVRLSQ